MASAMMTRAVHVPGVPLAVLARRPRRSAPVARSAAAPLDHRDECRILCVRRALVVHRADARHHGRRLPGGARYRAAAGGPWSRMAAGGLARGEPRDAGLFQVLRAPRPHRGTCGGGSRSRRGLVRLVRGRPSRGHQLLHVPDAVVHHRRVAGRCARRAELHPLCGFRQLLPASRRGPADAPSPADPAARAHSREGDRRALAGRHLPLLRGLSKKVLIADRLGNLVDPLLAPTDPLDLVHAWLALLGYAFQIYFDFSGYSDMAIGLGRLFGIELPQNFNSPYKAVSPRAFWRRWHMTLSFWLRDYLYISLGGNRCPPARRRFNIMVTMVLGVLWHGACWTFAAWGAGHGLLLL